MEGVVRPVIKKLDKDLEPEELIEIYFSAVHQRGVAKHSSAITFCLSSGQIVAPILWNSLNKETHNQRGNIGSVISILEWIDKNNAREHEVNVYTVEEWMFKYGQILDNVNKWRTDKDKKVNWGLYQKILSHRDNCGRWPRIKFIHPKEVDELHVQRHADAYALAWDLLSGSGGDP